MASLQEVTSNPFLSENFDNEIDTTVYQPEDLLQYYCQHKIYFEFNEYFNHRGFKLNAILYVDEYLNTYKLEYDNDNRRSTIESDNLQDIINSITYVYEETDYSEHHEIFNEVVAILKSHKLNFRCRLDKSYNVYASITVYDNLNNSKLHDITINTDKTIAIISKFDLKNLEQTKETLPIILNLGNKFDFT